MNMIADDSFINQLISIIHEIHQSFDDRLEFKGVFLDISKDFNKEWHDGSIYKLKQRISLRIIY